MADLLNIPDCGGSTGTANTGIPVCDAIANIPSGLIGLDSGVEFTSTDMATKASFVAKLKTLTRAPRGGRAYPIWRISNFEDQTTEATKIAVGNLTNVQIKGVDAVPAFSFQHRIGEIFHKGLQKLASQNLKWLIIDDKYLVLGTKTPTGNLTGYSATEFEAGLRKFGTPTTVSNYPFSLQLADITEYKENSAFFQADSTIKNISGNNDVVLSLVSQAANVANVTAIASGGKNLGDLYATELADVTAWEAKNVGTGASFTITSVTYNSTSKNFIVTVDATAYGTLTTGDKVSINLISAAGLSGAGVDGFESTSEIVITKA